MFYKAPKRYTSDEIIAFIDSIDAVSVLAHPFLNLNEQELIEFLSTTKGLDGMECYYSDYDEETINMSIRIANKFGLVCCGGSDFHGDNKPDIKLGVGKGNLNVPFECYLNCLKKTNSKRLSFDSLF